MFIVYLYYFDVLNGWSKIYIYINMLVYLLRTICTEFKFVSERLEPW